MPPPRLIMLSGLAADGRMFNPQRVAFDNLSVPAWLPPLQSESLRHYARRMAATIDTTPPFIIGGASFGGMLAQEIAKVTKPQCVILIASATRGDQVAVYLRWFEALMRPVPSRILDVGRGLAPLISRQFNHLTPVQARLVADMIKSTPIEFTRWGARAIFEWPGAGKLDCPVYHIHGGADRLIPPANMKLDQVIAGGGHLINITHPDQVNAFIAKCIKTTNESR